jgi:hypothetical protein
MTLDKVTFGKRFLKNITFLFPASSIDRRMSKLLPILPSQFSTLSQAIHNEGFYDDDLF